MLVVMAFQHSERTLSLTIELLYIHFIQYTSYTNMWLTSEGFY